MSEHPTSHPGPVTGTDVRTAVALAAGALRSASGRDWRVPAGGLSWTCWQTAEHVADDLLAYAAQLGPEDPPVDDYVRFTWQRKGDGPALAIGVSPDEGVAALARVLEACGGLLAAVVDVTPPQRRAFHPYGVADPEGFAAMGVVETLVHTHDVALALDLPWSPPAELCDRVLHRLFPEAPSAAERWPTLLWATGRGELPGHQRRTAWRWDGRPHHERTGDSAHTSG